MRQYQVTELTAQLKRAIAGAFPGIIMVHGEVTGFARASSGHVYFSLKDAGAKLKAAYFRTNIRPDSFIPKNGDKVSVIGELRVYEPEGSYQLIVRRVIYSAEGEFWQKFEETKKRLEELGFFDPATKRPIPAYPKRIALLTASGGAAVKDFIVTSYKDGNFFDIDVWPIPVQGKDAAPVIAKTIEKAGARTDIYQVLVLSRGGGSLEDLSVFNDESVARALKASEVPAISAIGHEQDVTICDMVADLRAATPTAAAEAVTAAYKESLLRVSTYSSRLLRFLRFRLENVNLGLDNLERRLSASGAPKRISELRQRLNIFSMTLTGSMKDHISLENRRLFATIYRLASFEKRVSGLHGRLVGLDASLSSALRDNMSAKHRQLEQITSQVMMSSVRQKIKDWQNKADLLQSGLISSAARRLTGDIHRLEILQQRLELNSPERLLSMGYALVFKDGRLLRNAAETSPGDGIEIKMQDGNVSASVDNVNITADNG